MCALDGLESRVIDGTDGASWPFWSADGRWIAGQELPHLLKDFPVREFLCHQRRDYSIELQLVPQQEFDDRSLLKIQEILTANLPGLPIKIELKESVVRTKSNKWRPVISEVNS